MYRGFNLRLGSATFPKGAYEAGIQVHSHHQKMVQHVLDGFEMETGALDGSKMQANWFPQINADVFISHSHADEKAAIAMAGWLKANFSLDAFVDSCAWGFADRLLHLIDREYCYNETTGLYDYSMRNRSTSHVHMMLVDALSTMIDRTEALFFVNTPNSILPSETIGKNGRSTKSPWIFSEIAMTRLVEKRSPAKHRIARELRKAAMDEVVGGDLEMLHKLETSHLTDLSVDDLKKWLGIRRKYPNKLDALYSFK